MRSDGIGGVVGFSARTAFRVSANGYASVVAQRPEGSLRDVERLSDGRIWALACCRPDGDELLDLTAAGGPVPIFSFNFTYSGYNAGPSGPPVAAGDGLLYGTERFTGPYNAGRVYRVSTTGDRYEVLYNFTGGGDGHGPTGLVRAPDGANADLRLSVSHHHRHDHQGLR